MDTGRKPAGRGGKTLQTNNFPFAPVQKDFQLPSIASVGFEPPAGGPSSHVLGNPIESPRIARERVKQAAKNSPQRSPVSVIKSPEGSQRSSPLNGFESNRSTPRRLLPIPKSHNTPPGMSSFDYSNILGQDEGSSSPNEEKPAVKKKIKKKVTTYITPRKNLGGPAKSSPKTESKPHSQKPVVPKISDHEQLLSGNLDKLPPQRSSVVRVFVSSTFSDFKAERNALAKNSYPEMKQFCAELGLDFQVVDLRWGISEEATNDHAVEKLCLREVEQCQRLSRGTNFVAMLGDRYGFRPIPTEIDAAEFEKLRQIADELKLEGRVTMDTWYRRDDNADPPAYILQSINSRLPHFTDTDPENVELKKADASKWVTISTYLATSLRQCATEAVKRDLMTAEKEHTYYYSVTEQEITSGVLTASDRNTTCLVYTRHLTDIEDHIHDPDTDAARYIDLNKDASGTTIIDTDIQELRNKIQQQTIPNTLQKSNIRNFSVPWKPKGVNPTQHAEHQHYMNKLCESFSKSVKKQVQIFFDKERKQILKECTVANVLSTATLKSTAPPKVDKQVKSHGRAMFGFGDDPRLAADLVKGRIALGQIMQEIEVAQGESGDQDVVDQSRVDLHAEVLHHMHLCHDKCGVFCGRQRELASVEQNLKHSHMRQPLVIHAKSGAGKTAFSAMIAKKTRTWLSGKAVIVVRFLGTSPQSSTLRLTLISVCLQICAAYRILPNPRKLVKRSIVAKYLKELMLHVSVMFGSLRPLVVVLDSLDQLSPAGGAHDLSWLPVDIPSGVHFIVSLKPEAYGLLSRAQAIIGDKKSCFLELTEMSETVILEYIGAYSAAEGRNFTDGQCEYLLAHLSQYPQPLLMKICLDEACRWHSYTGLDTITLPSTVKEAIGGIFDRYEKKYGRTFMAEALGLITASKGGIGHVEIEDALSCSDDVLNEVYKFHNPPIEGVVRIPPLLWARAKHDLRDYIVERIAQSKATLFWYHYQFFDAARERYLDPESSLKLHKTLAEIYQATEPIKRTITLERRKLTITDADREVTLQPLSKTNTRKLVTLPYHLLHAGDQANLRGLCWCSLDFLLCYAAAYSLYDLLAVMSEALTERDDMEIRLVYNCLRYSAAVLTRSTDAVPVQLLGSLLRHAAMYPSIQQLCDQCSEAISARSTVSLLPTLGSIPLATKTLKWYYNGPSEISAVSRDRSHMLLLHTGQRRPAYQVINSDSLEVGSFLQNPSLREGELAIQCLLSSNSQKVFLLYSEYVQIYDAESGQRLARFSNSTKQGDFLNHQMALSPHDQYLVLAGADRMTMFELNNAQEGTDYKPRAAMNLGGSLTTTNLMFSHDHNRVISTHTLQGKKNTFGAVVLWNFWEKQLVNRVGLPSDVVPKFLYRLQPLARHDLVICGCDNGHISVVDMDLGKVIVEIGDPLMTPGVQSTILTSFDPTSSCLLTGVKGQRSIQLWNMDITEAHEVATLTLDFDLSALSLASGGKVFAVGDWSGNLSFYPVQVKPTLQKRLKAHNGVVSVIECENLDQIFTSGADNQLKLWDLEVVEEDDSAHSAQEQEVRAQNSGKSQCLEDETVNCCCLTENGQTIITGSNSGIKIWKRDVSTFIYMRTLQYGSTTQLDLTSDDSSLIALTNQKPAVLEWADTGAELDIEGLNLATGARYCYVKGESAVILSISGEESQFWSLDLETKAVLQKCIVKDANLALCAIVEVLGKFAILRKPSSEESSPNIYHMMSVDMETGQLITCCHDDPNSEKSAKSVFSFCRYDDETLYLGCHGDVLSWQPAKETCITVESSNKKTWLNHFLKLYGHHSDTNTETPHKTPVTMVTSSTSKKVVVTGGDDGSLILWADMEGKTLKGHSGRISSAALTSDATYLVTGSHDRTVRLWNLTTRRCLCIVHVHMNIDHVALSQDDSMVIARASETDQSKLFSFDIVGQGAKSTFFVTE